MAKGTRGDFKGRDSSGATKKVAPEDDAPTLKDLGIDAEDKLGEVVEKMEKNKGGGTRYTTRYK